MQGYYTLIRSRFKIFFLGLSAKKIAIATALATEKVLGRKGIIIESVLSIILKLIIRKEGEESIRAINRVSKAVRAVSKVREKISLATLITKRAANFA